MSLDVNMMANHLAEFYGDNAPPWEVLQRAAVEALEVIDEWRRSARTDGRVSE